MNIVVVGGSRGLGAAQVSKFQDRGDTVAVISHADVNFNDPLAVTEYFDRAIAKWDQIDILLYVSNGSRFQPDLANFHASAKSITRLRLVQQQWDYSFKVSVIVPHLLSLRALSKMNNRGKIVFVTSGLAQEFERTEYTHLPEYAGSKAAMNHLMLALAHNNDRGVSVYCISPHLERFESVSQKIFDNLLTFDTEFNGTIIKIWT
jgi:NAD(P)-dependent dehydrogenase (short-subunit alcohol dehydrogenase family)